eukprot:3976932-Lingulodinium_polyedra.AAC.1
MPLGGGDHEADPYPFVGRGPLTIGISAQPPPAATVLDHLSGNVGLGLSATPTSHRAKTAFGRIRHQGRGGLS